MRSKYSKYDPYLSLGKKQTKAFKVFGRWEEVEEELEWNLTLLELVFMGVGILDARTRALRTGAYPTHTSLPSSS